MERTLYNFGKLIYLKNKWPKVKQKKISLLILHPFHFSVWPLLGLLYVGKLYMAIRTFPREKDSDHQEEK